MTCRWLSAPGSSWVGTAQNFCAPNDVEELRAVLQWAEETGAKIRVLGGGANLLVCDGSVDGLVLSLSQASFCTLDIDDARIQVGAGVDLMQLSRDCSYRGLAGFGMPSPVFPGPSAVRSR